jgi:uncharacterized protein (DUF1499 family)
MSVAAQSSGKISTQDSSTSGVGASWIAVGLGVLALLAIPIAGFGIKHGYWGWQQGLYGGFFTTMFDSVAAAIIGLIALMLALVRGSKNGALPRAIGGLVVGLVALGIFLYWTQFVLTSVPRIHDISTDTANPPAFVALAEVRKKLPPPSNSTAYDPAVAPKQAEGYPDLKPAMLDGAPAAVFPKALAAAEALGWAVVASDAASGRIEATQTSFWMGFTDDVVIRLAVADGGKTKLDIRSESRVGGSDFGMNAKRIRAFLAKLQ